jgi:hypothetical protein
MFLGLLDPDPYPLVRGIRIRIHLSSKKILRKIVFLFFDFFSLINDVNEKYKQKSVFKKLFLGLSS